MRHVEMALVVDVPDIAALKRAALLQFKQPLSSRGEPATTAEKMVTVEVLVGAGY
jgi:hypothetical protein